MRNSLLLIILITALIGGCSNLRVSARGDSTTSVGVSSHIDF